jgi:hypothetical protein
MEQRVEVDAPTDSESRRESQNPAARKPAEPPRPRGDAGSPPGGNTPRQASDSRRRRGNEPRFVAFGDGLERFNCARADHLLAETFPVASHAGAATIARAVVARRGDALLLCNFTHCDAHVWPDGEEVATEETLPGTSA